MGIGFTLKTSTGKPAVLPYLILIESHPPRLHSLSNLILHSFTSHNTLVMTKGKIET